MGKSALLPHTQPPLTLKASGRNLQVVRFGVGVLKYESDEYVPIGERKQGGIRCRIS